MKKLPGKLLLAGLPIIFILLLGIIVDKGLRKSNSDAFAKWNAIYESKINADILILGPSRAEAMISSPILADSLNLPTFNLGMSGWGIKMQIARFDIYLQHNKKPKYIIQNIDYNSFKDRDDLFEREQFMPYLSDPIIRNITSGYYGHFSWAELNIPFVKYIGNSGLIRKGIKCFFNKGSYNVIDSNKGWLPNSSAWDSSFSNFRKENINGFNIQVDTEIIRHYEDYLNFCRDNGINIIMVIAPTYYKEIFLEKNNSEVKNLIKSIAIKHSIPLLDYSRDSLCYNTKYFYNSQHLNKYGAEIYSSHLANDLKHLIKH